MKEFKNIIDISWPISSAMTTYKDNKPVNITAIKEFKTDSVRDTNITLNTHTGTHVDAPAHFLPQEMYTQDIPLQNLMGSCIVLDIPDQHQQITANVLSNYDITSNIIVLLKTSNSKLPTTGSFNKDFVFLEHSGAQYLANKKVKAVGIDYLGIERSQPEHETHTTLLSANIPIIEGLRLANATATNYFFIFLPLNIEHVEASPGRAILLD